MILISGSSGFIGNELLSLLKKKGIKYKTIKTKDINKKKKNFFKNVTVFVHLGFNFFRKQKEFKSDNNITIIKSVIKFAEDFKFKIIFPSTASYKYLGKKKKITKNIFPFDRYSQSKINCERLLKNSFKKKKTSISILRIFNVYGEMQKKGWLIPDLISKFSDKKNKNINLDYYSNTRDFIHVKDVAEALLKSLKLKGMHILNIGTSKQTKILEIALLLKKYKKSKKNLILLNSISKKNNMSKADISLTKKKLNWKPKIKLRDGLKKIFDQKS